MSEKITVDLIFECANCNRELDIEQKYSGVVKVEPCEDCLSEAFEEGKEE